MPPGLRKLALTVHITLTVAWVGAVSGYLVLDVTGARSTDAQTIRAAYVAMDLVARSAIVPLAISSVATGIVMAAGTKWGLFRHYWVVISLVMTVVAVVVLLIETQTIRSLAEAAADPSTTAEELRALPSTLGHSIGGLVVLLVVLVLNTYKPRGLTRHGRRAARRDRPSV